MVTDTTPTASVTPDTTGLTPSTQTMDALAGTYASNYSGSYATSSAGSPRSNANSTITWGEALRDFLMHVEATRAAKTVRYYRIQLRQLCFWAEAEQVPLAHFGKRHLDRYLVERQRQNKAQTTLHHDAVCAKAFFAWCSRNDIVDRSLLAEYQVRKAPTPAKYMPTEEDMQKLLAAVLNYWDPAKNPDVRYNPLPKRLFHRDRNLAAIIGLLDTACRIGELLNLKMDDYQPSERQITIRVSKGREPRVIPVSREWQSHLDIWLKVRKRVMGNVSSSADEGWLFISETGTRLEEERFLKTLKKYVGFAGASEHITLHSLRRYSLNRLAKHNLLMAQTIAGHKETKTTLLYTKLDPDFIRDMHDQTGVVRSIVQSKKETIKRKRLV